MKKIFLLSLLFAAHLYFSQNHKETVIKQANEMRNYFMEKNYNAYSNYVDDGIIKMFGDKKKMISTSVDAVNKMSKSGYTFKKVDFSEADDIIHTKNELQTVVHQKIEMETPNGNVLGDYYLIAISKDNGKFWKFIDTSGKDIESVRKFFPNVSPKLYIPKTKLTPTN